MAGGAEFNCRKELENDVTTLFLSGEINERTEFAAIFEDISTTALVVNLKGITRINSCGVRDWVNATKPLASRLKISYVECSRAIVDQLNMIVNFLSAGKIVSFYAPYFCEKCDAERDMLIEIDASYPEEEDREEPSAPELVCPECNAEMCFNEDEEKYLSFLSD